MTTSPSENSPGSEPRYDRATLEKVVQFAGRLQDQHQESLTAREIEAIGAEVGLQPAFVRQALSHLTVPPTPPTGFSPRPGLPRLPDLSKAQTWARRNWPWLLPPAYFVLLYITPEGGKQDGPHVQLAVTLLLLAPLVASGPLGYMLGKKRAGLGMGFAFAFALYAGYFLSTIGVKSVTLEQLVGGMALTGVYGLAASGAGVIGAYIRQRQQARAAPRLTTGQEVSRADLLQTLFALQGQLEGQKQHRAFLSIDVAGSSEMKRQASELEVEFSFRKFQQWVEEFIRAQGGEMQAVAGDGMMCLFHTDAAAVRAARELQAGLPQFNVALNRLPTPFRVRCGVSAGEVAIEPGRAIGRLQSAIIDRAANLQKRAQPGGIVLSAEVAAADWWNWASSRPCRNPVRASPPSSGSPARTLLRFPSSRPDTETWRKTRRAECDRTVSLRGNPANETQKARNADNTKGNERESGENDDASREIRAGSGCGRAGGFAADRVRQQ